MHKRYGRSLSLFSFFVESKSIGGFARSNIVFRWLIDLGMNESLGFFERVS